MIGSLEHYMSLQVEEVNKYKWIRSEEVGYDLGDAVVMDWIKLFAASYRNFYEGVFGPVRM